MAGIFDVPSLSRKTNPTQKPPENAVNLRRFAKL